MQYHEYDFNGWYIGPYRAETPRPNSTDIPLPEGLRPAHARWNGSAWILDPSREQQTAAQEADDRTRLQQAIAILKSFNPNTATTNETRAALGATIYLLREVIQEIRP